MRPAVRTVVLGRRWTPAKLFAGGQKGVWYDPSDLSSMFQNSNGTTAVAVGDPVGWITDKSGNGNHAIQATAGHRPILRLSGGLYYLDFDGVDDCLQASATLPAFMYLCVGFRQADAGPMFIEQSIGASTHPGFFFYGTDTSSWLVNRGTVHRAPGATLWPGTADVVGELLYDGSGTYWKNGVAQSNGTVVGSAQANTNVNDELNIFSRTQGSLFTQGRLYGLTIAPSAASSMQSQSRTWMGTKAGVVV